MKRLIKISLAIGVLAMCSCSEWLNVGPDNEKSEHDLFKTGEGFEIALNGIYECLSQQELYGQELTWGFLSAAAEDYDAAKSSKLPTPYKDAAKHQYNTIDTEPIVKKIWENMYKAVANCNNLIQHVKDADPSLFTYKQLEKNVILGEAYALRGMIHFDLLRLFAPAPSQAQGKTYIPYQEVHPTLVGMPLTVPDFMQKVIADLKRGRDLTATMDTLPEYNGFVSSVSNRLEAYGTMNGFFGFRSTRLNYYVNVALLARAYQYAGESQNAIDEAKKLYDLLQIAPFKNGHNFSSSFTQSDKNLRDLKSHKDLLFCLFNNDEITYCRRYHEGTYGLMVVKNPDILYAQDLSTDLRRKWMFYNTENSTHEWVSLKLYESTDATIARTIHPLLPMIRIAEIYFILAEETYDSDPTEALRYLKIVRDGRKATSALTPSSKEDFLKLLRSEAAREWICEGQTFFIKKRHNVPASEAGLPDDAKPDYVLPIPSSNNVF